MKAIVCEMCGGNDVVKQDGLYICQNCGTKYTAEDAKKLMIDISGSSIKVDEKEKAESYTVIEYYETAIQPNAAHFPSGLKNAAKASDNTKNSVNDFTRASLLKGHGRD